jgi:RNA polymerase sigma-70 factor (ECF subfamily)
MEDADAALLTAFKGGSERAFNQLVDRHQQGLRAFLRGLVGAGDADDVAQETFLALWSHANAYRGDASVRTWLFAMAWRKAQDSHRRRLRQRERDSQFHTAALACENDAISPVDRLAVRQALTTLPLDQRAAVWLCLAGGFTHTEAADALGLALGTVKSHVLRGRERLRDALEQEK